MIKFIKSYMENRKKLKEERKKKNKLNSITMYLMDDCSSEWDIYIPDNHKILSLYPLEDREEFYIIAKKFLENFNNIKQCLLFAVTNWGRAEVLCDEEINKMFAKIAFDDLKNKEMKNFFRKKASKYESLNYLDNIKKFHNLIDDYCRMDYFTLYVYNKNIEGIKNIKSMENYLKNEDYLISFSLKAYHDEFFISYDENYISEEELRKKFQEVCDELGLILKNHDW